MNLLICNHFISITFYQVYDYEGFFSTDDTQQAFHIGKSEEKGTTSSCALGSCFKRYEYTFKKNLNTYLKDLQVFIHQFKKTLLLYIFTVCQK